MRSWPEQVSNEEGYFAIPDLPPARYRVRASLDGFQTVEGEAVVAPGGVAHVTLDLPIAAVAEHVDVVAKSPVSDAGTLATTDTVAASEAQMLAPGDGYQAALRLLSGVIQVPGGDSIDGGRPNQAGVQLGSATLLDSATNLARVSLPADGIDSVSVLPNPYEVEFGRFSSGLVLIQTRRAGDKWRVNVNNLEPALRLKRFTLLQVTGITAWKPSFELGGPLVKNRVFLEQTGQYHYQTTDIPSRPETELKTNEWFSSLTRVDAKVSDRQSIIVAGGFVPSTTKQATLGTFTPPDATVDVDDDVSHAMFTERSLLGAATAVEGTFQFHETRTDVASQGSAPMELLPETTLGNFFNLQHRNTATYQWIETATHSYKGVGGIHLFKVGFDLLHNRYEGTSASKPVLIERSDGTLARRLDFDGPSVESVHSTDFALFAQDRFQPTSRWYIEFGGRVRSGWHHVGRQRDAACRCGRASQRFRHRHAARRLWSLLRAHAINRCGLPAIRAADRHTVRDRRPDAARPSHTLRICDLARPADCAQRHVGHFLRLSGESLVVPPLRGARPSRQSRAHRRSGSDGATRSIRPQ